MCHGNNTHLIINTVLFVYLISDKPATDKNAFIAYQTYYQRILASFHDLLIAKMPTLQAALLQQKQLCDATDKDTAEWRFSCLIAQLLNLLSTLLMKREAKEIETNVTDCKEDEVKSQQSASEKEIASQGYADFNQPKSAGFDVLKGKGRNPESVAPKSDKLLLSAYQITTVKSALQLFVCLGLYPNLASGVGVPLQRFSKLPVPAGNCQRLDHKHTRLASCVAVLLKILKVPEFRQHVTGAYLNFILASGLQLAFAPKQDNPPQKNQAAELVGKRDGDSSASCASSSSNCNLTAACSGETSRNEQHNVVDSVAQPTVCVDPILQGREMLELLISCVPHDRLVRELLVLNSGLPTSGQVQ